MKISNPESKPETPKDDFREAVAQCMRFSLNKYQSDNIYFLGSDKADEEDKFTYNLLIEFAKRAFISGMSAPEIEELLRFSPDFLKEK